MCHQIGSFHLLRLMIPFPLRWGCEEGKKRRWTRNQLSFVTVKREWMECVILSVYAQILVLLFPAHQTTPQFGAKCFSLRVFSLRDHMQNSNVWRCKEMVKGCSGFVKAFNRIFHGGLSKFSYFSFCTVLKNFFFSTPFRSTKKPLT